MALSVADCTNVIRLHTRGLAAAADGNLGARIEHCPEWSMADLVWHLTCVHRFWTKVVVELPTDQPEDTQDADRPPDDELIPTMLAAMDTMVASMQAADQAAPCWTWGLEENVGFVTRHQVQEAAVHHWDAANAVGADWELDDTIAMDAVEEFLTHSVANRRWPNTGAEPLGGTLTIPIAAPGATVVIADGSGGTLTHALTESDSTGADPAEALRWLYRRLPDLDFDGDEGLVERFRAFTNTD
jgi:uncharacterized protein (TIGR03083 family)